MSSAASKASSAASSVSSSISKAIPTATAAPFNTHESQTSTQTIVLTTIVITATTILLFLAGIYYSGYADDFLDSLTKKTYSAKARGEATILANTGNEKVQGVLKGKVTAVFHEESFVHCGQPADKKLDSLKKNPVMGEGELEQVSSGLGKQAVSEGVGGVSERLGGLGKVL